jgi:MFS family permease
MPTPPATLLNTLPATYGTKLDDHTLEQYKLFVDSSHKVSDRRLSTNSYFLTINSSLLTLMGLLAGIIADRKPLVLLCVAGMVISWTWLIQLEDFQRLNSAKFNVINELEAQLPANVFQEEWRHLSTYRGMSRTEKRIPWTLIALYVVLGFVLWFFAPHKSDQPTKVQIESPVRVEVSGPNHATK